MRIVFLLSNGRHRVFRGDKLVWQQPDRQNRPGDMILKLDGVRLATWYAPAGPFYVTAGAQRNSRVEASQMYCDNLPYTLEDREWKDDGNCLKSARCIFCGRGVWHINDPRGRGDAWTLAHKKNGADAVRQYLYCNRPECNNEHVWCCVKCSIDNVGNVCADCGSRRETHDREAALARGEEV